MARLLKDVSTSLRARRRKANQSDVLLLFPPLLCVRKQRNEHCRRLDGAVPEGVLATARYWFPRSRRKHSSARLVRVDLPHSCHDSR